MELIEIIQTLIFMVISVMVLGTNVLGFTSVYTRSGPAFRFYGALTSACSILATICGLLVFFSVDISGDSWFDSPFSWYALSLVMSVIIIILTKSKT